MKDTHRERERERQRETDRQKDTYWKTEREKDRQTDRQTERKTFLFFPAFPIKHNTNKTKLSHGLTFDFHILID